MLKYIKIYKKLISICLIVIMIFCTFGFTGNKVEAASTSSEEVKNILFIGNSKTFYNIMPKMFRNLVTHSETNTKVYYLALTAGGRSLQTHATKLEIAAGKAGTCTWVKSDEVEVTINGTTEKISVSEKSSYELAIKNEWDYVIIQGQTDDTKAILHDASSRIINILKESNGERDLKVIYNAIWPSDEKDKSITSLKKSQATINGRYEYVAAQSDSEGTVAYTGNALMTYITKTKDKTSGYINDKQHPTPAGSYLEACVLYKTIFGENTSGIEYYGKATNEACKGFDETYNYGIVFNLKKDKLEETDGPNRAEVASLGSTLGKELQNIADNVSSDI